MKKRVVFILSHGFSGSSLLSVILGSHPNCFSAGELKNLPRWFSLGINLDRTTSNSTFWEDTFGEEGLQQMASVLGNVRLNPNIPLKLDKFIRKLLRKEDVFNVYSLMLSKLKKDIIIDASKSPEWISLRLLAPEFTQGKVDAYLINLNRDGRAVINSSLRRFPENSPEEMAEKWVKRVKDREEVYNAFPSDKKLKIRYESLATQPYETTKELCNFIGIKFIPDMLEYWKHEHHDISGNGGTYSLIKRYQNLQKEQNVQQIHDDYYGKHEFDIKLDQRWKQELPQEYVETFERIAGSFNRPYEWN